MKSVVFFFLLGIAAGAVATAVYLKQPERAPSAPAARTQSAVAQAARSAQATAGHASDAVAQELRQARLMPDDLRKDLAETGQVVRTKAVAAGQAVSDARILSVIKAKYLLDGSLSAFDIHVTVEAGKVTLDGSVTSLDLIGRAVAVALGTDGVRSVTSHLVVEHD